MRRTVAPDIGATGSTSYASVASRRHPIPTLADTSRHFPTPSSRIPTCRSLHDMADAGKRPSSSRYARQIILPEIGPVGQARLRDSSVLVVGAGGLGSPVITYLAAAGIGTVGVVDDDVVDASNLHRQPLHGTADIGRPKVRSAQDAVSRLTPDVRLVAHQERLTPDSARRLIAAYDLVVDGSDNFPTRYAAGQACADLGRPHVWGAALGFQAQVSVWWPPQGPCYRCVFPDAPTPGAVPSCAEAGVVGALVGAVGSIQAMEAVKILLGIGDPLVGRVLVHDALAGTWGEVSVRRDPGCPACSGMPPAPSARPPEVCPTAPLTLSVAHLREGLEGSLVVDVRPPDEWAGLPGPATRGVELGLLRSGEGLDESLLGPRHGRVVFVCRGGVRSAEAAYLARSAGWTHAMSLEGGALAWEGQT